MVVSTKVSDSSNGKRAIGWLHRWNERNDFPDYALMRRIACHSGITFQSFHRSTK